MQLLGFHPERGLKASSPKREERLQVMEVIGAKQA
jgi:hypothetical protein